MSEPSAIWMFLSICAICFTWYKISTTPSRKDDVAAARDMKFLYNGQPVNGSLEINVDGRTSKFKLIDGKIP
jgi:hypothetical protein